MRLQSCLRLRVPMSHTKPDLKGPQSVLATVSSIVDHNQVNTAHFTQVHLTNVRTRSTGSKKQTSVFLSTV